MRLITTASLINNPHASINATYHVAHAQAAAAGGGEQPASRSSKDCNAVSFRSRFVLGEHFTTFKPNIKDLLVTVRIGTYDNIV